MLNIIGTAGRILFAVAMAALGLQGVILADFLWLEPVPAWLPAREASAVMTGAVLLIASLLILAGRRARPAAGALALVFVLCVSALHAPALIANPGQGGVWGTAFKVLALASAAWLLCAPGDRVAAERRKRLAGERAMPARIVFGLALLVFGVLHLVYHDYIASLIPAWIPGRPQWPYLTGIAQVVAAGAVLAAMKMRLAATLVALMYGLWVLVLHVPRVLANPSNAQEWTDLFMAVALCGCALLVAASATAATPGRKEKAAPTASEIGQ